MMKYSLLIANLLLLLSWYYCRKFYILINIDVNVNVDEGGYTSRTYYSDAWSYDKKVSGYFHLNNSKRIV